jgi:hypothetical protein
MTPEDRYCPVETSQDERTEQGCGQAKNQKSHDRSFDCRLAPAQMRQDGAQIAFMQRVTRKFNSARAVAEFHISLASDRNALSLPAVAESD